MSDNNVLGDNEMLAVASGNGNSLASLLTFHYDRPTTEEIVFKAMFDTGDQAKIQREGFSLLDMKVHLARQGLTADGYKMSLDRLAKLGVPVITLIDTGGYRHFVIIKGIREDDVVIGDPAQGVIIVQKERFEPAWSSMSGRSRSAGRTRYPTMSAST